MSKLLRKLTVLSICFLGTITSIHAAPQESAAKQANQEQLKAFHNAQALFQNLQQKLATIQKAAFEANPELVKKEESFRKLLLETMKKGGHTPEKDFEELKALQTKARDPKTSEAERKKLLEELQQKNVAFQQMQRKVMQDPAISKAQADLNKMTMDTMKKDHPETEKIVEQMQKAQQEMMRIRQAAMRGSP